MLLDASRIEWLCQRWQEVNRAASCAHADAKFFQRPRRARGTSDVGHLSRRVFQDTRPGCVPSAFFSSWYRSQRVITIVKPVRMALVFQHQKHMGRVAKLDPACRGAGRCAWRRLRWLLGVTHGRAVRRDPCPGGTEPPPTAEASRPRAFPGCHRWHFSYQGDPWIVHRIVHRISSRRSR